MNSTTFVLFDKYCPIVDQLGSKDLSRDFQLNCVISYFLPTFNTLCKRLKIDVIERVKKVGILRGTKQGAGLREPSASEFVGNCQRHTNRSGTMDLNTGPGSLIEPRHPQKN
jgi:hypothetical protein